MSTISKEKEFTEADRREEEIALASSRDPNMAFASAGSMVAGDRQTISRTPKITATLTYGSQQEDTMHEIHLTSESVTEGHPDKLADRISDAVLDTILRDDPSAHVACETFLTTGLVLVGGEISTSTYVNINEVVRRVLSDVGYDRPGLGFHYQDCAVLSAIKEQSSDIAAAVGSASEVRLDRSIDPYNMIGAGDQGMMFGYARSDTDVLMPLPIVLAHRLTQRLAQVRKDRAVPFLRPDGKSQVTVEYEGERPVRANTVLIAAQHDPDVATDELANAVVEKIVRPIVGDWLDDRTQFLINSSGVL